MALIDCPECKKKLSSQALRCTSCDFNIRQYLERLTKRYNKEKRDKEAKEFDKIIKRDAKKLGVSFAVLKKDFTSLFPNNIEEIGYVDYYRYGVEVKERLEKSEEKRKQRQEKSKQREERKQLIREGKPEINYNEFEKLIKRRLKKQRFYNWVVVLATITSGCALYHFHKHWTYLLLIFPVISMFFWGVFMSTPKKKLETVFGSVICFKYDYSYIRLSKYYRGDLKYYSQFKGDREEVPVVEEAPELIEAQEVVNKAQEVANLELMASQTDESVVSLINSFQDLGLLHRIAFNRDLADYCRSEFNDNFLFLIQPIANNNGEGHFFCEKGVLKTTLRFWKGLQPVYYHYSELSNLEKNRAGALRDKPTGYEIKGFNSEDWQSPIIDFINSKRNELSPANKT